MEYSATHNRIRCMGHIINLSAQSFLFVNDANTLEDATGQGQDSPLTLSDMERFRKLGPLGKLHNFIVHIGRTPQRKQQWKLLSRGKWISRDNGTRWSSWEKMLREALPLRRYIDRYFEQYSDEHLCKDRLSDDDWAHITKVSRVPGRSSIYTNSSLNSFRHFLPTSLIALRHSNQIAIPLTILFRRWTGYLVGTKLAN